MSDNEYLSTREAATALGISLGTVQKMVESGVLEAWKTEGGHRRIPTSAIRDHLAQRQGGKVPSAMLDVLVAEDNPIFQTLYQSALEKWDFPIKLRIVDNGFDGLLQVGSCQPDVLITDLMMPGMDGFDMIRRLRSNKDLANMVIVVVSSMEPHQIAESGGLPADIMVYKKPIPLLEIKGYLRAIYQLRLHHGA
ncbi:MAG: response regulator [Dechloromonas sp.]|uniref:Response regulator n=1 Tax=Candidatus Dechloromonas phosphorivorans TaxID=2899244 RepID=A0A935K9R4_9RHOO|nr:response regulator [Candidatus Dechloromonas phosphorivorans]